MSDENGGEIEPVDQTPNRGGRPSKFTPEVRDRIIKHIGLGATLKDSCEAAGVSYATFRRWMVEGDNPEAAPEYREFKALVERTDAQVAVRMSGFLQKAAQDDPKQWKAALEWLQRRRRDEWRPPDRTVDLNQQGGSTNVFIAASHDEIARLRASLEGRARRAATAGLDAAADDDDDVVTDAELVDGDDD